MGEVGATMYYLSERIGVWVNGTVMKYVFLLCGTHRSHHIQRLLTLVTACQITPNLLVVVKNTFIDS